MPAEVSPEQHTFEKLERELAAETLLHFNMSAQDYLSGLKRYLVNLTVTTSRQRPSDLISTDRSAGIVLVIIIPILYFVFVALVLILLLCFFWHKDKDRIISEERSDFASRRSVIGNNERGETIVTSSNDIADSNSFTRSYPSDMGEIQAMTRASVASKGSVRTLGVLTHSELDFPLSVRTSLRNAGLTLQTRKPSRPIQEKENTDPLSQTIRPGMTNRSTGSQKMENVRGLPGNSAQRRLLIDTVTKINESLSTDSLEDDFSKDSLRASMDSHKNAWMSEREIRPDDLYDSMNTEDKIGAAERNGNTSKETNKDANSKDDINAMNHTHQGNQEFRKLQQLFDINERHFNSADNILKIAYDTEINSDLEISDNGFQSLSSSNVGITKKELDRPNSVHPADMQICASTKIEAPFKMRTNHLGENVEWKTPPSGRRPRLFTTDAGTNMQERTFPICHSRRHEMRDTERAHSARLTRDKSTELANDRYNNNEMIEYSSDNHCPYRGYYYEVDLTELNISSASRFATTSLSDLETDNSQDSSNAGQVESSLDSVAASLPSSISRFHASKIGNPQFPVASYPMANTTQTNASFPSVRVSPSSKMDVPNEDERYTDSTSLSANVGSSSQSTTALSELFHSSYGSHENFKQQSNNVARTSSKVKTKLKKRPSPIAQLAAKLHNKLSQEEKYLAKSRDEDEDQLRFPLLTNVEENSQRWRHSMNFHSCGKVSTEQRLQEFGFIKAKGQQKEYIVNPSPGKFSRRHGSVNHVFTYNEEGPATNCKPLQRNLFKDANICEEDTPVKGDRRQMKPAVPEVISSFSSPFPRDHKNNSAWKQESHMLIKIQPAPDQVLPKSDSSMNSFVEVHGKRSLPNGNHANNYNVIHENNVTCEQKLVGQSGKEKDYMDRPTWADNSTSDRSNWSYRDATVLAAPKKYTWTSHAVQSQQAGVDKREEISDNAQFDWTFQTRPKLSRDAISPTKLAPELHRTSEPASPTIYPPEREMKTAMSANSLPVRHSTTHPDTCPTMEHQQMSQILTNIQRQAEENKAKTCQIN